MLKTQMLMMLVSSTATPDQRLQSLKNHRWRYNDYRVIVTLIQWDFNVRSLSHSGPRLH